MTQSGTARRSRDIPMVSGLVLHLARILDRAGRAIRRPSVVLVVGDGGVRRLVRRGGRVRSETTHSWSDLERAASGRRARSYSCEVRLEAGHVVDRVVELPAAGRDHLPAILDLQIERMTPWSADRVAYDHLVLGPNASSPGMLSVRVVAASKAAVSETVSRLRSIGARTVSIGTAADPLDRPSPVDLLGNGRGEGLAPLRRASRRILAFVMVLTLGTAALAGVRVYDGERAVALLQARLAQSRDRLEAATRTVSTVDAAGQIETRKRNALATAVLIEELARLVPDTTFLTEFAIDGRTLRLAGISLAASDMIRTLEDSPILSGVRFSASVVREPDGNREQFRILADIEASGSALLGVRSDGREAAIDGKAPTL